MKKYLICKATVFSVLASLAFALMLSAPDKAEPKAMADASFELTASSSEQIVIASSGGTAYKLYFSADSMNKDQELAKEIQALVLELYGCRMRPDADIMDKASAKEILIGNTNRKESATLLEKIKKYAANPDDLVWAFAVINGKLLYTANSDIAMSYGAEEFLNYLTKKDFTVPSDLFVIGSKDRAEYEAEKAAEEEAARQEAIKILLEANSKFTQTQFGGNPKLMFTGTSPYNPPATYPTKGQHPRLFITEDKLDEVISILNDKRFTTLVNAFWKEADEECDGIFPRVEYADPDNKWSNEYGQDWYQYDEHIISVLQNKAFAYLITGNEVYGYEAIIGAKNMILSLAYSTYIHMDMYHGPSHIMIAVAKIYDWCYDLLSEDDKNQLIAGVSNILAPKMEIKFPPSGYSPVSGHGTGPQFLRDYFMVSVAFYDEIPNWWDFVGGRYYQEYVPAFNESIKNGWVSQGTTVYGPSKLFDAIISARLIYLATGQYPYDKESMQLTTQYLISHIQPNGRYFQTGDGTRYYVGASVYVGNFMDVATTFQDPVLTRLIYEKTSNLSDTKYLGTGWGDDFTFAKRLAYIAYLPDPVEDSYYKYFDTIQYFAEPAGNMTARNNWGADAAVAFMKIGTRTLANHDILDHGTFQIYYKSLLAGTSGMYVKYGSNVHKYYLQSTVAHNGILVFNPAFAAETPSLGSSNPLDVRNGSKYFYSGGQRARSEAGTLANWLSEEYDMAEMTGHSIGYTPLGESEYGYIAGNIAKAYSKETVSYLERRMLSVFTGDPNYPMLFFTFDTIEAVDASFAKSSLIHVVKEPYNVDESAKSADIRFNGGRLYVQSLFGADAIEAIGGEGRAHWINGYYNASGKYIEGKNCVDTYAPTDSYNNFWGRIQFTASGQKETQMLNAMFVTDESNNETPAFEKLENSYVYGAEFDGIYALFLKSREKQSSAFSVTTSGKGLSRYYISGIGEGIWSVKVDGISVATLGVDPEEGFASFIAPSGNVTFEPLNIGSAASISEDSVTEEANLAAAPYTEDVKISAPEGETPLTWCAVPSVSEDKFQLLSKVNKHALARKH